jgi:hypothetical protein
VPRWKRAVLGAAWIGAVSVAVVVARWTEVGPVLVRLPGSHGVHLGDVAAVLAVTTAAALTTYSVGRRR